MQQLFEYNGCSWTRPKWRCFQAKLYVKKKGVRRKKSTQRGNLKNFLKMLNIKKLNIPTAHPAWVDFDIKVKQIAHTTVHFDHWFKKCHDWKYSPSSFSILTSTHAFWNFIENKIHKNSLTKSRYRETSFHLWNSLTKHAFSDKRQGSLAYFLCNKGLWAHSKK